jgi:hypothetical protein
MMSKIKDDTEVLHQIKVKLYNNYLPGIKGAYLARTINEAMLSINDICAALKHRGGFEGNFENLVDNVCQFLDEMAYQLCDGFAVNMKYFSVHPNIGGTFDSVETYDPAKNPLTFRFRIRPKLKRLIEDINVLIDGIANNTGWIDEYIDVDGDSSNALYVPGNLFVLNGHKIKIAGDDPSCGLYYVPLESPSNAVKVSRISVNSSNLISGIAPTTGYPLNKIEVRTQFLGSSNTFLKAPRVIQSLFTLEEV